MKGFIKLIVIAVIVAVLFLAALLLGNYVHYGTFIFK